MEERRQKRVKYQMQMHKKVNSEVTEVVDNESKVSDAEKTEMGDGDIGDKVTDNSVNVEQLDKNMADINNDSEGSDLGIDQEEVNKLFQGNKAKDQ